MAVNASTSTEDLGVKSVGKLRPVFRTGNHRKCCDFALQYHRQYIHRAWCRTYGYCRSGHHFPADEPRRSLLYANCSRWRYYSLDFLGQKNYNRATDVVNNVFALCLIHSIVFGGLTLIFLEPILLFFGATADTVGYAMEFMEVILYGTPIGFVFIGLNNLMRATGYPRKAMTSALISVAVNLLLAPLFILFLTGASGERLVPLCAVSSQLLYG